MKKVVLGLASNETIANKVIDKLLTSGFTNQDISILTSMNRNENLHTNVTTTTLEENTTKTRPSNASCSISTEKHTKAPEGATTGATAGGIIGGSLGLLAGIGTLAIPGLGPFIAAGPIMAALSGSAIGGGLGLILGALVGAGFPEYEAKLYEAGIKEGNILISVHTETEEEMDKAISILRTEGVKKVSTSKEKTKAFF